MKELIRREYVNNIYCRTNLSADSWQDSIRKAALPLIQNNYIEKRYIDSMICSVLEYGPYIVIDKGIALAHARPNDGVLKTGIALATFTPAVKFGSENDPVKIMIVLAAAGDNEHVELLAFIADLLGDENSIKEILSATDDEQLNSKVRGICYE